MKKRAESGKSMKTGDFERTSKQLAQKVCANVLSFLIMKY